METFRYGKLQPPVEITELSFQGATPFGADTYPVAVLLKIRTDSAAAPRHV